MNSHPSKEYKFSFESNNGKLNTIWNPNYVFDLITTHGLGPDKEEVEDFLNEINENANPSGKKNHIVECLTEFNKLNVQKYEK